MNSSPSNPQFQDAQYPVPVSALNTFALYDRAGALAAGFDPASYDSTRATKRWLDTSADPSKPYTYGSYDGTGAYVKTTISGAEAATLNVWGVKPYPVYVPAPTPMTRGGAMAYPANPTILSTRAQAWDLASEWKVNSNAIFDATLPAPPVFIYGDNLNGETRKIWNISYNGLNYNVGEQIALSKAHGDGAPGHWELGQTPQWVSDIPAQPMTQNPEGPVPQRQATAREQVRRASMMDPQLSVFLVNPQTPAVGPDATNNNNAGFTQADRDMLKLILQYVSVLPKPQG